MNHYTLKSYWEVSGKLDPIFAWKCNPGEFVRKFILIQGTIQLFKNSLLLKLFSYKEVRKNMKNNMGIPYFKGIIWNNASSCI